jgi:GDP-4-dehydro-6-deoxy-D-mannose reductase
MLARRSVLVLASCALTGGVVHVADEGMRTVCATTIDGTNESHRRDCVRRLRRPGGEGAVCDEPRRVLITGISGMIGSHLARVLVTARCTNVYGLVRPRSDLAALRGVMRRIRLVQGDIADSVRMRFVVDTIMPHYIYHMAAQAINGISDALPDLTLDVNIRGTLNLLEPLREAKKTWGRNVSTRVLLAGSSTEYGKSADTFNGAALPESAPLLPVSPYGVSKVATENLGRQFFLAHGVQVIIARFFIQVGVGGTDSLAIHEFCKQIALAELGLSPAVVSHGNLDGSRDMTDASDSAPVVVALAERGVVGEAYNVGSGRTMTVLDLLHTAISLSKIKVKAQVDKSRFRAYDEKILLANISKIRALTGWKPSTNMTSTVEKILDYWRRKVAALYGDSEGDDWWTPHAPNPVVASSGTSPHVVKKEKKRADKGHAL